MTYTVDVLTQVVYITLCFVQDYYIAIETNLPSHFYRYTRPEMNTSGSEDSHITVTFPIQVCVSNSSCYKHTNTICPHANF